MKSYRLVFREVDRAGFNNIKIGRKTVETRAATTKYRHIQPGDQLVIACGGDSFTKTVVKAQHFASVDELLAAVPMRDVMPEAHSREDVGREYRSYPGYEEKIAAHGLMAFFL